MTKNKLRKLIRDHKEKFYKDCQISLINVFDEPHVIEFQNGNKIEYQGFLVIYVIENGIPINRKQFVFFSPNGEKLIEVLV